jgi:hypothetical protein
MAVEVDHGRSPRLGQVDREPPGGLVHPGHGDAAEQMVPGGLVGGAAARVTLGEGGALALQQGGQS